MANVWFSSFQKKNKLDGSLKHKVYDLVEKLTTDHTAPGLHVEPMQVARDKRIRTARVDIQFRAVLFQLDDKGGGEPTFIYMGTWNHDEAIKIAENAELKFNPVNGVAEAFVHEPTTEIPSVALPTQVESQPGGYLATVGYTFEDLTEQLGLAPDVARRALKAIDEDAIMDVAAGAVEWQGSALLSLATGHSIGSVREELGLDQPAIDPELDEDEKIIEALERPASKMQFAFIEDNDELRRVIEAGDFGAWRTFLHPEQRKYVVGTWNGPFRLSGGAGTGKTVVAMHRARHLAHANPGARIVLTTYNKTLAADLERNLRFLDPSLRVAQKLGESGVYVAGVDALATAVISRANDHAAATAAVFGQPTHITSRRTQAARTWRDLAATVDHGLTAGLASPGFLEAEYVSVVLGNRLTTLEQYAKVPRPGRGVRLSRPQRIGVWKLIEAFRRDSQMDASLSFPEILAIAASQLEHSGPLADHVIIDEAQDLHATHWTMLRALVGDGPNDLFIAEDSHQRIYGQPIVLSRYGIRITGRSRRLTLNYRTTAQNLAFAVGILSGASYKDIEDEAESTSEYRSARSGPAPRLIECASLSDELEKVTAEVRNWLDAGIDPSIIAVLTRGQDERTRIVRGLGERGISARALDENVATPGVVQVLTMHRSKGMEFSRVVLAGVDNAHVPSTASLKSLPEQERADAMLRERSLLYVASSRARDELVVTWAGELTNLIAQDS